MQWHTVKKGETLATIAKKLRVNRTDLAEANYLKVNSRVAIGKKLVIPRMPSSALLAQASSADLEKAAAATVEEVLAETTAVPEAAGGTDLPSACRRHAVDHCPEERGDGRAVEDLEQDARAPS